MFGSLGGDFVITGFWGSREFCVVFRDFRISGFSVELAGELRRGWRGSGGVFLGCGVRYFPVGFKAKVLGLHWHKDFRIFWVTGMCKAKSQGKGWVSGVFGRMVSVFGFSGFKMKLVVLYSKVQISGFLIRVID